MPTQHPNRLARASLWACRSRTVSTDTSHQLHANSVAFHGKAILITGGSGSGKSALSLGLMAIGCELIADDQSILTRHNNQLIVSCPAPISGQIEARGIGILKAKPHPPAPLSLVVDLARQETDRLPPARTITYIGIKVPLILQVQHCHFAAAILQYMSEGRSA